MMKTGSKWDLGESFENGIFLQVERKMPLEEEGGGRWPFFRVLASC